MSSSTFIAPPDPTDPANVAEVERIMAETAQVRVNRTIQPLRRIFVSPYAGYRDKVPLREIPDEVMHAANTQHRRMLDLLEAAMNRLDAPRDATEDLVVSIEIRAMLALFNRPYAKGNYGEPYYDPPQAVKDAQSRAKKNGWGL